MLPLHRFVPAAQGWNGRPAKDRLAIARAVVAKAANNFPTTRGLIDRLHSDTVLRRIRGWDGSPNGRRTIDGAVQRSDCWVLSRYDRIIIQEPYRGGVARRE
jgi:hypothetical protein